MERKVCGWCKIKKDISEFSPNKKKQGWISMLL